MSLAESPPAPVEPPPPSRTGALAWAAAAGLALTLALVALSRPEAALGAAAALLTAGAAWALSALPRPAAPAVAGAPAPAAGTPPPFAAALERLSDPVLVVTGGEPDDMAARRVAFANAAARELLRIDGEGALLVNAVRRPEVLEAVDEALYGGVARSAAFDAAGAQDRAWRLWAAPLPSPEDAPHALLHLRDETDARAAERMRVDFLANASHELRTPLASLAGFIETLRGHAKDDPAARDRFLAIMAGQAERMSRLTSDLLQLSRVELNEHIAPTGRCDLALVVADVADALQPQSESSGVRFDLRLPERGRAVVVGDRDQLVQVVQNLADNALKYSPRGGAVRVEVRPDGAEAEEPLLPRQTLLAPDRDDRARYVQLRIADSGPGLARDAMPRLTERFYRVEGWKSGERPGTGLGLAIVRHIVNRHRGGMAVESAPGAGAAFTVSLPAAA